MRVAKNRSLSSRCVALSILRNGLGHIVSLIRKIAGIAPPQEELNAPSESTIGRKPGASRWDNPLVAPPHRRSCASGRKQ